MKKLVYLLVSILVLFSVCVTNCSAGEMKEKQVPQISDKKLMEVISGSSLKMPDRVFIPGIKEVLARIIFGHIFYPSVKDSATAGRLYLKGTIHEVKVRLPEKFTA